jgi:hypothetical protein
VCGGVGDEGGDCRGGVIVCVLWHFCGYRVRKNDNDVPTTRCESSYPACMRFNYKPRDTRGLHTWAPKSCNASRLRRQGVPPLSSTIRRHQHIRRHNPPVMFIFIIITIFIFSPLSLPTDYNLKTYTLPVIYMLQKWEGNTVIDNRIDT